MATTGSPGTPSAATRDLEHSVKLLGSAPLEAIHAATALGGRMFDRSELGLVNAGCLADLLRTDGDPSADVSLLQDARRLIGAMKDGRFHKDPLSECAADARAGSAGS